MKRRFSADKVLLFKNRKKSNKNKLQISILATEARINIDENQQLFDAIDIINNLVKQTKSILHKLTSKKKVSKIEIINNLNEEKNGHIILNKSLKGDRNFIKLKYNKSKNELNQIISNLHNELDILVNRKFIYENALFEKRIIIQKDKLKLNNIKLFEKVEEEKYITNEESDEIYEQKLKIDQIYLKNQCKLYNKIENKCNILFEKKRLLLDELYILRHKTENSGVLFINNNELKKEIDEKSETANNKIISDFSEDNLNISLFQINLIKSIIDKRNIMNNFKVTKLLFEQIKYNSERNKHKDAEKSLSRIFEKEEDLEIKKLKSNIKKMKRRINKREIKLKELEDIIQNLKNFIHNKNLFIV